MDQNAHVINDALMTMVLQEKKRIFLQCGDDLGFYQNAKSICTDGKNVCTDGISQGDNEFVALLIDKELSCRCLRRVRIEGEQIFIISPSLPYEELSFKLDCFEVIEKVTRINYY